MYNEHIRWLRTLGSYGTCLDLSNCDCRDLNLSGCDLRFADMRYANLSFVNLRKSNLSNANLFKTCCYLTQFNDAKYDNIHV